MDKEKTYTLKIKGLKEADLKEINDIINSYKDNIKIEKILEEVTIEEEFNQLWEIYPKKRGKKDALRHYTRARRNGISYNEIKNGLDNYVKYIKENNINVQYIKNASSWFNQESWNDDYTVIKEKNAFEKSMEEIERVFHDRNRN